MIFLRFSYVFGMSAISNVDASKTAQYGPKTAARRSKMAPRRLNSAQDGPKIVPCWLQDASGFLQDGPKSLQDSPKTAQDASRWLQDGSKTAQFGTNTPPDSLSGPRTAPRSSQDGSKTAPRRPKTAPRRPKTAPRPPREALRCPRTSQDGSSGHRTRSPTCAPWMAPQYTPGIASDAQAE